MHKEYYSEDTSFFNLNTTFTGNPKTQRGFSWQATEEYSDMVIEYSEGSSLSDAVQEQADYTIQSAMEDVSKGKICTLDELRTNR